MNVLFNALEKHLFRAYLLILFVRKSESQMYDAKTKINEIKI